MGNLFPLYVTAVLSVPLPLFAGLYFYRRLKREMKILLVLFAIVTLVEGYTFYQTLNQTNYYWVHHIYMPLEYGLLVWVFSYWQNYPFLKRALRLSIPVFVLICIIKMLSLENLMNPNSFTASVAYASYVGISSYTMISLQEQNPCAIHKDFRFWVGSALLVYSTGGLAYFAFRDTVVNKFMIEIWSIHAILNIIAHILYSIGFICQSRR